MITDTREVTHEVFQERAAQDEKWGEQNHRNGTGNPGDRFTATADKVRCDQAAQAGTVSWRDILQEEVSEAFAEHDHGRLRAELVQVAAVAVAWIEALDRRT